jgi:hypothetical protein
MSHAETCLSEGITMLTDGRSDEAEAMLIEAAATAKTKSVVQVRAVVATVYALSVYNNTDDGCCSHLQGRAFGNLANIYMKRGLFHEALGFNEKSLDIFRFVHHNFHP